jgi:hypothetical protein
MAVGSFLNVNGRPNMKSLRTPTAVTAMVAAGFL